MDRRSFATDPAAPSAPPGPGRATIEDLRPGFDGPAIVCDNLVKIYTVAGLDVVALQGLDLRVEVGELMAIVGASGSGKSTLMNILGGLDSPSAGRAVVAGTDLGRMNEGQRADYRRRVVSFVWQQTERNHLPYLSAIGNVELPMMLDGVGAGDRALRTAELLDLVGVDPQRRHLRPEGLSGGEQQRVAVAIALANRPSVLLADEPTGRLDTASAADLFAALRRVNRETGTSIVLVTHDPLVADHVQRTVAIRDGRTSTETLRRTGTNRDAPDELTSEEFAVLDAAGRLQLPRAHVEALELRRRVRLRLEHDHIGVWPDEPGAGHDRQGPRPLGGPERADAPDPHDAGGSQGAR